MKSLFKQKLSKESLTVVLIALITVVGFISADLQSRKSELYSDVILRVAKTAASNSAFGANVSQLGFDSSWMQFCKIYNVSGTACALANSNFKLNSAQNFSIQSSSYQIQDELSKAIVNYNNNISNYDLWILITNILFYSLSAITIKVNTKKKEAEN